VAARRAQPGAQRRCCSSAEGTAPPLLSSGGDVASALAQIVLTSHAGMANPRLAEKQIVGEQRENVKELLDVALRALKDLLEVFRVERFVYLGVAVVSFGLLVYSFVVLVSGDRGTPSTMTMVLGGSGLATAAALRVSYFMNRGFALIESILRIPAKNSTRKRSKA